jgi:F-type H+-transporting ATPase subunit b
MRFDWTTLALQTVNLFVLVWLLRRFLFRPVVAIITERRRAAEKLLSDAAASLEAAQAEVKQVDSREKALAEEGDRILVEARVAAKAEQAALLRQAKDDIDKAREAAQASLEQERVQIRRELETEAHRLAVTIASRLLARLPGQAPSTTLLQALDAWLTTLPIAALHNLAIPGETLAVVTPAALDAATQASCADILRRRLGSDLAIRFETDASLLAGVELRGPHARLRNSWRADLDRIAEELSRDDRHVAVV